MKADIRPRCVPDMHSLRSLRRWKLDDVLEPPHKCVVDILATIGGEYWETGEPRCVLEQKYADRLPKPGP